MRIDGEWYVGDDGIARPVIRGKIRATHGSWVRAPFLIDTGADLTVLNAAVLRLLGLPLAQSADRIGGVGGMATSVCVETTIRLVRDGATGVVFRGQFAALTELEALDTCVLGRDITGLFSVIVDQPASTVCLLRERHRYSIESDA